MGKFLELLLRILGPRLASDASRKRSNYVRSLGNKLGEYGQVASIVGGRAPSILAVLSLLAELSVGGPTFTTGTETFDALAFDFGEDERAADGRDIEDVERILEGEIGI